MLIVERVYRASQLLFDRRDLKCRYSTNFQDMLEMRSFF